MHGGDGNLHARNPNNSEKWKYVAEAPGGFISGIAIAADGTIYVGGTGPGNAGRFYAVTPSGTLKWKFTVGNAEYMSTSPAVGADGTVYTASSTTIHALKPADGSTLWSYPAGVSSAGPAVGADGTVYFGSINKTLYAFGP